MIKISNKISSVNTPLTRVLEDYDVEAEYFQLLKNTSSRKYYPIRLSDSIRSCS